MGTYIFPAVYLLVAKRLFLLAAAAIPLLVWKV